MSELSPQDAAFLLGRPEFRRFIFAAIQTGGILGHHAPANGQAGRDLGHFEGRRSLVFDLLQMIDRGHPEPLQSPESLATIDAAIREALNPPPKEKTNDRRNDRYDDIPE